MSDNILILPVEAKYRIRLEQGRAAETMTFTEGKAGDTSDGFHTFHELYEHRMALTLQLMKAHPKLSWRSKQHHIDGDPMFDGFFIVGMNLPTGMISYHYKLEHWHTFKDIREVERAPKWDGHTPADVVTRLLEWKS